MIRHNIHKVLHRCLTTNFIIVNVHSNDHKLNMKGTGERGTYVASLAHVIES